MLSEVLILNCMFDLTKRLLETLSHSSSSSSSVTLECLDIETLTSQLVLVDIPTFTTNIL